MESYSVEAVLKASGASQFSKAFINAAKGVEGLDKSIGGYSKSIQDAIKKSGGFIDAQGRLRNSQGQFMSATEKAKYGLQGFGNEAAKTGKKAESASVSIGSLFKAIAGSAAIIGAFNGIRNSIDGAISRFDTLNTFPSVMEMMGFSAEESEKAIKRLSDGIDGLPTALDEVTGTAQRLATMTGDLDGAVETTLALNNAFLASGASTADASRGLEQYVQMLATGTVDLQSWRTLQETMPIALNKTAEAFGFAGESAQNDLYEALKAGEITFDEFNSKIIELSNETGGFADLARESSTGIRTSWQNVKTAVVKGVADMIGSIDEALSSFGGISGVLDRFKEGVKTAFGFVNSMIPVAINLIREVYNTIKPWLPLIASVVTAFLTFNIVVGTVNSVKSAVMGLRAGIALLNATLLANPVALVIAVLAGLAVMFVHLWNTSESFRQKVTEVFQAFLDFVMPIVETVVTFIQEIWGQLVAWWQENNEMIMEVAQAVWSFVQEIISIALDLIWSIMQTVWTAVQDIVMIAWDFIIGIIQGAVDLITGIIQFFAAFFTGNWSSMWDAVKSIVDGALNIVKSIISGAFDAIKSIISTILDVIKDVISAAWEGIKTVISGALDVIKSTISNIWDGIKNTISDIVNNIKDTISDIFNSLKGIVSDAFNNVKDAVKEGMDKAYTAVTDKIKDFFNAGKNIVTSIADGIKNAVGKVTDAISGVTQKIRNFLPFSPAKEGALRDIMDIQIAQSIAQAIDKGKNVAVRSMANLTDALYGEMPQIDIAGSVGSLNVNRSYTGSNVMNPRTNGITQNITIVSPEPTSPSENARKFKQVARQLALEW
ncbi:tape measure protein [Caldibacillus thermolactis]|jgi:tape measure domain-containing protein|uniref:Tape measure protein n=1 Tax=Pallidibacillus thermolactis TaxID=251051 RepID=A0ABT2WGN5_9BACI|nr:tape measure protein [Pallidibacillus thermolactis]MCU9594641.1 tape measure protein [Pallidibacillus thermolactis]